MKIEQLQQLLKIVEMGSMNEAARALYTARSSLSTSMKNLETELGAPIFRRNTKGVSLTDFGTDVYSQARDICERIEFLQGISGTGPSALHLTIASMYCSLANDAFAEVYRRHAADDFTGSVEECMLSDTISKVSSGLCEIGIVTLFSDSETISRRKIEEAGLTFTKIADRKLCAIVGPENPLYDQGLQQVTLAELKDYPYMVNYASPSDYSWERTLDGRRRKQAEIQVSDLGCALRIISTTGAIMIDTYDKETYAALYAPNRLHFIPLEDSPLDCQLGWIRKKDHIMSAAAKEFLQVLEEKAERQRGI